MKKVKKPRVKKPKVKAPSVPLRKRIAMTGLGMPVRRRKKTPDFEI